MTSVCWTRSSISDGSVSATKVASSPNVTAIMFATATALGWLRQNITSGVLGPMIVDRNANSTSDAELAFLSTIIGPKTPDVMFCLSQPSAVAVANMIAVTFGELATLVADTLPSDMLDLVQQTLVILSEAPSSQDDSELHFDPPIPIISVSDGKFERILLSRLLDFHKTGVQDSSRLERNIYNSCRRICMKGLWYFGMAFYHFGNAVPLPSCFFDPNLICQIPWFHDTTPREIARCVGALIVNKLVTDIHSRDTPVSDLELTCLST